MPPFSVRGERMRQNGPRRPCEVRFAPPPLLRRHTSEEMPSDPAISTASLCVSVESFPISLSSAVASRNSDSVSPHLADEGMEVLDQASHDLAKP